MHGVLGRDSMRVIFDGNGKLIYLGQAFSDFLMGVWFVDLLFPWDLCFLLRFFVFRGIFPFLVIFIRFFFSFPSS